LEEMLLPTYIRDRTNLYVPHEFLDYVRQAVFRHVPVGTSSSPRRIYVSRSMASRRRVINEAEVVECLSAYGIGVVNSEILSLEEQVRLFRQAELIVGPHGAGLTNMLFSQHAKVIEFLGDPNPSARHFVRLAATLGHEHHFVQVRQKSKNEDMFVDIDVLKRRLDSLIG